MRLEDSCNPVYVAVFHDPSHRFVITLFSSCSCSYLTRLERYAWVQG